MRGDFTINNPEALRFSVTLQMTYQEAKDLQNQLNENKFPSSDLSEVLGELLRESNKHFQAFSSNKEEVEGGEA